MRASRRHAHPNGPARHGRSDRHDPALKRGEKRARSRRTAVAAMAMRTWFAPKPFLARHTESPACALVRSCALMGAASSAAEPAQAGIMAWIMAWASLLAAERGA
jgi:hypothetical protein